jgi:hypothetical protein
MTAKTITRDGGDPTDFDETRRLLYMALLVNRTKRYNLAATLVNALAHHHLVTDLTAAEITDHVVNATSGIDTATDTPADAAAREASLAWIQAQADRITAELGDGA